MVVRRALFVPYSAGCRRSLSSLIRVLALTAAAPDVRTFLIRVMRRFIGSLYQVY